MNDKYTLQFSNKTGKEKKKIHAWQLLFTTQTALKNATQWKQQFSLEAKGIKISIITNL